MSGISGKELTSLGTRAAFNKTLRHLVNVTSLIENVDKGANLAELLNKLNEDGLIAREQISPILSVILVSKFDLPYRSMNLKKSISDFSQLLEAARKWNAIDFVLTYYHPNLGVIPVNPANEAHWQVVHDLKKDELIVVYAKSKLNKRPVAEKALNAFFSLLAGNPAVEDPEFIDARARTAPVQPAAEAQAQAASAPKNITPKYSVQVTNELFHNGNVEAWKNIIESYETAQKGCKVIVYHEGELIQDLNSLFKWGKVKHGGIIFFQVTGNSIKNVSRLQKYLFEGASNRFENFLKHDVNRVLELF